MIRKPTEKDFQEGTAVTVLRETKRVAVATGDGAGEGFRSLSRTYLYGVTWFGILATVIPAMLSGMVWQGLAFIGICYGVQQLLRKGFKMSLPYLAGGTPLPPEPVQPADLFAALPSQSEETAERTRQSGHYTLTMAAAMRRAMTLGIPGLVLLFLSIGLIIALIPALALLATAALVMLKAFADKDLLRFDHRSVTVNNLLGSKTMLWDRIDDVAPRVFSRLNLKVLVTVGTRRTIALRGMDERGAVCELLIPIALLDLDKEALVALVSDLICCRAAGGEVVPSWQEQPEPAPPAYAPTPTSDPRESFDADAIMKRYLAERSHTIGEVRPDLIDTMPRPTFGRKVA